ncbi:MAG TPA: trypsin-like peptidase domain-containing protein [Gemmatimonadales bacterium]
MNAPAPAAGTLAELSNDLADAVARVGRSVVAIQARRRIPSSGVVWGAGIVVAANHTITRDEDISVTLPDGDTTAATLSGRDPSTDLAVLRIESTAPPVERSDDTHLQAGRLVLAVGRPGPQVTASLGIVSAVGGEWRTWHGGRIDRFVRLDLSVYDGFSGGPLVEVGGRVLGINTSGLSRALALALPGTTVDRVVGELVKKGRVTRGYLGLAVQPVRLPEEMRRKLGLSGTIGLVIVNLETGGPADRAGLLLGDIITGLDGREVGDPSDILALLGSEGVGKQVSLRILRAGEARSLAVTVGERPPSRGR